MVVAVVGGSGYIGSALLERLRKDPLVTQVLRIGRDPQDDFYLDLNEPQRFDYDCLTQAGHIVFAAAVGDPDKCAEAFDECWKINVTGTAYFIRKAIAGGSNVMFISSDAVFGDIPGAEYTEASATRACTPYGRMKKALEDQFLGGSRFKTVRLSYVLSAKNRFVMSCLDCIRRGAAAAVPHPFYRNCTSITDVADAVCWLIRNWSSYQPGALNIAGPELVSRVRIADELNRIFGDRLKYTIYEPEPPFFENRSHITQMKSLYLKADEIVADRSFSEMLKDELSDIQI